MTMNAALFLDLIVNDKVVPHVVVSRGGAKPRSGER